MVGNVRTSRPPRKAGQPNVAYGNCALLLLVHLSIHSAITLSGEWTAPPLNRWNFRKTIVIKAQTPQARIFNKLIKIRGQWRTGVVDWRLGWHGAEVSCPRNLSLSPVPRQNSIHLYFQQLRSSFSQPLFSKSKFALSVEASLI